MTHDQCHRNGVQPCTHSRHASDSTQQNHGSLRQALEPMLLFAAGLQTPSYCDSAFERGNKKAWREADLDFLHKVSSMAQEVRPCIVHYHVQVHSVVAGQLKSLTVSVCLYQNGNIAVQQML